ncbi:glycosyltransferase family 1 protein [Acinetobacter soli]|uniref:glycosyltransferase family 4 protein n=1 Tax=Acinetobacter soli TaxID=487316 RepID=UPI00300CF790
MIYINGRFLTQNISGVQRFGREIISHLFKISRNIKILVPSGTNFEDFPDSMFEVVGKNQGHVWEQLDLYIFMRDKNKYLLNLTNTAPLLYDKNIFTLHDIIFLFYPKSYNFLQYLYYKLSVKRHLKKSKLILTVSNYSKKSILGFYKDLDEKKIQVIYNAVPEKFLLNSSENRRTYHKEKIFCVLSSFDENKNLQVVIDAFKINSRSDIRLLMIGSHVEQKPNQLKSALEDSRIKSLGKVNDQILSEIYQSSYAFIIPSKMEGFGIPPLEAQSFGCPVLASNTSSLPEILGHSALYFDPDNPEELSNLIDFISDDFSQRESLSLMSYENVKRFDFRKSAEFLINIIEELDNER